MLVWLSGCDIDATDQCLTASFIAWSIAIEHLFYEFVFFLIQLNGKRAYLNGKPNKMTSIREISWTILQANELNAFLWKHSFFFVIFSFFLNQNNCVLWFNSFEFEFTYFPVVFTVRRHLSNDDEWRYFFVSQLNRQAPIWLDGISMSSLLNCTDNHFKWLFLFYLKFCFQCIYFVILQLKLKRENALKLSATVQCKENSNLTMCLTCNKMLISSWKT